MEEETQETTIYITRQDQEDEFVDKFKSCQILGVSACPGMGKSCFMERVINKLHVLRMYSYMLFMTLDASVITSSENFHNQVINSICQNTGVNRNLIDKCCSSNLVGQIKFLVSQCSHTTICIYFDNIPRPSDHGQIYSAKDDVQNFMLKMVKGVMMNNQLRRVEFKLLFTSVLDLYFSCLRPDVVFTPELRPLNVREARHIFTNYSLTADDIPDEILQCFNDRDIANGNPTVLTMIASELAHNRDLLDSVEFKELVTMPNLRQKCFNQQNYAPDDCIRHRNNTFIETLPADILKYAYKIASYDRSVTVRSLAAAENKTSARVKFDLITLLRNHVAQGASDGGYCIPALMKDGLMQRNGIPTGDIDVTVITADQSKNYDGNVLANENKLLSTPHCKGDTNAPVYNDSDINLEKKLESLTVANPWESSADLSNDTSIESTEFNALSSNGTSCKELFQDNSYSSQTKPLSINTNDQQRPVTSNISRHQHISNFSLLSSYTGSDMSIEDNSYWTQTKESSNKDQSSHDVNSINTNKPQLLETDV